MRFMIMVRATPDTEAGGAAADEGQQTEMADYHEALARAGVLLDAAGLLPSAMGWRIRYHEGRGTLVDGPAAAGAASITGYTLIQTRSREEAMEWARRCPAPRGARADAEIEVRQLCGLDGDTGAGAAHGARP